jgi:hypothetical protein
MAQVYEVLKIMEQGRIGEGGGFEKFYRHTIKTKGGTQLTIDIDEKDFTAAKAGPILLARATEADKILSL